MPETGNKGGAAAATKTAPEKPKTVGGFALTAKITLGKNGEGKAYNGTDNNPKRANSGSFKRFAAYKNDMTVQQALDAGLTGADLSWDARHKFINIA
jgi:hypothetical protein